VKSSVADVRLRELHGGYATATIEGKPVERVRHKYNRRGHPRIELLTIPPGVTIAPRAANPDERLRCGR